MNSRDSAENKVDRFMGSEAKTEEASRNRATILLLMIIAFYALVQLTLLRTYPMLPDELWFMDNASLKEMHGTQSGLSTLLNQENDLGYGASYWILCRVLVREFGTTAAVAVLRSAASAIMIILLCLMVYLVRDRGRGYQALAALFWLTLPMAWWTGKRAGPEIFSLFFLGAGTLFALREREDEKQSGWYYMLLGFSAGIKLNTLPVIAGFFLNDAVRRDRAARLPCSCLFALIGLVGANPFTVIKPFAFLRNVRSVSGPLVLSENAWTDILGHLKLILWNHLYEWDLVYVGGYFQWGISLIAFFYILWLLAGRRYPAASVRILGAVTILSLVLVMVNDRYVGWYWFPLILFQVFAIVRLPIQKQTIIVLIALNLLLQSPVLYRSFQLVGESSNNQRGAAEVQSCIDRYLAGRPDDYIIDRMEIPFRNKNSTLQPGKSIALSVTYLLGDRLMKFTSYRRRFGDLLEHPSLRCGYVSIVSTTETMGQIWARTNEIWGMSDLL